MGQGVTGAARKAKPTWRDVLALYGDAMCSAQILEGELVQILYYLHIVTGQVSEPSLDWAYRLISRKPLGDVLDAIRGAGGNLPHEHEQVIAKAITLRNFLAHKFFHKFKPPMTSSECERVSSRLQKDESKLNAAYKLLQPLRLKLEKRIGEPALQFRQAGQKIIGEKLIEVIESSIQDAVEDAMRDEYDA